MKSVLNYKRPAFWIMIVVIVVCISVGLCFFTNPKKDLDDDMSEADNSIYENIVSELGDNEAYAFLDMNYKYMVLLTSDLIHDEENEKQVSVCCDIYYPVAGEAKKLGTIMSDRTAYPVTFTNDAIFTVSGHNVEKYVILEDGKVYLEKSVGEQFDEYGRSQIVHFSYGADGSVNEYLKSETFLEVKDAAMDIENLQREMERVVSSIGLENAYTWKNAVNFENGAEALIKMASDESGRFEIYGIISAEYGEYGFLLNDCINGEQNWSYAYMPWIYTGEASSQPILEPDGTGKYIFAYVYGYEDSVPVWHEYILDCGYDTGHMELISLNETVEDYEVSDDYYKIATSMSATEVEKFAQSIKTDILSENWETLSEKILYPISIDGLTLNGSSDFKKLDFNGKLSQKFVDAINSESCHEMFCNWQGIRMGTTGQIWIANVNEGSGTTKLKIIGINGMFDVS